MLRSVTSGLLAGLVMVLVPVVAQAAEDDGAVLVILDVSGSMDRTDGSGTQLIEGARDAVDGLLEELPDDSAVGLRMYGHTYAGNNEREGCRDTELAVPIAAASQARDKISAAVGDARPTGFTPIGRAIEQAASDFAPEGARTVILISDGEDTCNTPAPCRAARQLAQQGIDLRVDTVGFFLQGNTQAREQLECVANATGGTYVDAADAPTLTAQLVAASQRAIERYETDGQPVAGGRAVTEATPIEPGTAYRDDMVLGEARWYAVDLEEDQELTVTVTENGSVEYGCCATIVIESPDLDRVGFENGYNREGTAKSYRETVTAKQSGTHYVEFATDADSGEGTLDFEIQADITGGAEPEPTEEPDPSPEPAETETPDPTGTGETTAGPEQAAAENGSGTSPVLWVLLGLLTAMVLGLAVAVGVLFRKLARTSNGPRATP